MRQIEITIMLHLAAGFKLSMVNLENLLAQRYGI